MTESEQRIMDKLDCIIEANGKVLQWQSGHSAEAAEREKKIEEIRHRLYDDKSGIACRLDILCKEHELQLSQVHDPWRKLAFAVCEKVILIVIAGVLSWGLFIYHEHPLPSATTQASGAVTNNQEGATR